MGITKSKNNGYVAKWEGEEAKTTDKGVPITKEVKQKINGK